VQKSFGSFLQKRTAYLTLDAPERDGTLAAMDAAAQLDSFLDKFTPELAAHARAVLARMRARVPGAVQLVYDNYNALAVGFSANEKVSGVVFSVAVYPRWVSLFFFVGPSLPDPIGLLKGTGTTVRHIVVKDLALLDSAGVQALISEGLARAMPPINPAQPARLIIKSVAAKQRPRRPP
jgi:hypothetical protein